MAVAGTCTIKVHFSPTSSGSKTALLTIPSDAASSPDYAELDGTGTVGPGILLLPPFNDFGSVPVGNSSTDQTFTVTNSGNATLHVGTTSIGGTDASQFVKGTDGCSGASVAVAGTCTIKVHFSPTSSGSKTALLTIPSDAASSPDYAELDGTGTSRSGGRRPDGRIKKGSGPLIGNNVYNLDGANQTRSGASAPGKTIVFSISIENDGSAADRLTVLATGSSVAGYAIKYFHGTTNITAAVLAGTYQTASLRRSGTFLITVKVKVTTSAATGSSVARLITLTSVGDTTKKDAVKFIAARA